MSSSGLVMRLISVSLFALLLLIQYPLWLGRGGWIHVWKADQDVTASRSNNDGLRLRNAHLQSEVDDLKNGTGAIEERARLDLGMIKKDEIFVRILNADATIPPESSYEKLIHAAMPKGSEKDD